MRVVHLRSRRKQAQREAYPATDVCHFFTAAQTIPSSAQALIIFVITFSL